MGVAFIVLYPVLYTEATDAWTLRSRKSRIEIAFAGIVAELCLASLFLLLWHVSPDGSSLKAVSFLVVSLSLISSLLVNLNPLLKFDGYYVLSDMTGIDNLQHRACAFARWWLRKVLFGLNDDPPETFPAYKERFLILFGSMLITYRFFLFIGIAIVVYYLFPQPFGLFLMIVELFYFIGMPLWSELKIWHNRYKEILQNKKGKCAAGSAFILLLICIFPWRTTVSMPAIQHASDIEYVYAPVPARIEKIYVQDSIPVKKGDKLISMSSPQLQKDIAAARQRLQSLEKLRQRASSNPSLMTEESLSEASLEKARVQLSTLEMQAKRLVVFADFDGSVHDVSPEIQAGRFVNPETRIFSLVGNQQVITAYAYETNVGKLTPDKASFFRSSHNAADSIEARIISIAQTGENQISWPELSSVYKGPIAADVGPNGHLLSRRSLYQIIAEPSQKTDIRRVETGFLTVQSKPYSFIGRLFTKFGEFIRSENFLG
jgi:putative peptide zinc metalloprotease protein